MNCLIIVVEAHIMDKDMTICHFSLKRFSKVVSLKPGQNKLPSLQGDVHFQKWRKEGCRLVESEHFIGLALLGNSSHLCQYSKDYFLIILC